MNHEETPLQVVRMSSELAVIEIQRERKRDVCMKWTSKPQKGERICITLVTFAVYLLFQSFAQQPIRD